MLLRDLLTMHQTLNGDWQQADAAQRLALANMAASEEPGAAMAWAVLYYLNETNQVPTAEMQPPIRVCACIPLGTLWREFILYWNHTLTQARERVGRWFPWSWPKLRCCALATHKAERSARCA